MEPAMTAAADTKSSSQYHHGNLRVALLQAAVELIREGGVEKLSLRGLARKVGVSQTAPYRHFQDKNHLLVEIARQTFEEMTSATLALIDPQRNATENVYRCGKAYLHYAIDNPERYKLVFGPSIEHRESYPDLIDAGMRSFGVLKSLVEQGIQQGVFLDHCPQLLANGCWSSMHGFASLTIDGFYARQELPTSFDKLLDGHVHLSVRGLLREPEPHLNHI